MIKIIPQPKPTVYAGPDSSLQLCKNIAQLGHSRVLIVTDAMLHKMGLLDSAKALFAQSGIEVSVYDGVEPNPTFAQVYEGLEMVKANQCDAILAFGGGSSIDAAKLISLAATNKKSPEQLVGYFKAKTPGLPLFAVPTTAGTGSEVSLAAVVSDPATHEKGIIADPKTVPVAAALDPNIMLGLPPAITAATGIDALTHAVEAYLSTLATDESDAYALASVKLTFKNLKLAYDDGSNVEAREGMAVASFYAALAFNKAALGYVHGIAHQFGGHYNTPHGLANAIVLPHILEFLKDASQDRMAQLATALNLGSPSDSNAVLAQKFIDAVRELNTYLSIPETLDSLKTSDIPAIAKAALKESHYSYPVPKYMNQKQCEALVHKMAG
ncbi:iron-containing alcohol dehydrogenase [Maricurvus nonylphenolicus]|uniref:iron-containing alcohol dehydrogenase n=1 Tax=Maricurvus nonylphenolicus TaxID=1008307 RepID=UPI0036F3CF8B